MASQAGVFFFDMRPAVSERPALSRGLQPMALDGIDVLVDDGLAMAFGASHTWTGDRHSRQPWRSTEARVITWDGRLDNRDDLLLQLHRLLDRDASDAAIALCAFERWGIEGLRHLVGEWSAAIWDGRERTLHLARDYMGVRPLYYCASETSVMWSTSLGDLAERSGRDEAISKAFVAGFMTLQFSGDLTPYAGIRSVPCATCVTFRASGPREIRTQFWQLATGLIRHRDAREYDEQLRMLWSDAVRCRLRIDGTAWAELSGGLDSSSVVCMADLLIKRGAVDARSLHAASHATLESPEGDERRFIHEVEAQIGLRSEILGVERHQDLIDPDWNWVTPFAARGVGLARVQFVRAQHGRMVLSGRVGDAVMGCETDNSAAVFDDLADHRVLRALANLRLWSRACRKPFVEIAWHLLHPQLDPEIARMAERARTGIAPGGVSLLTRELRAETPHADEAVMRALSSIRRSKRELAVMLLGYSLESRLNLPQQPPGVVFSYPFTHRPLVQFVLSIPGAQLSAPGEPRSLMRRAFASFVPSRILARRSKGYYPPSSTRAARKAVAALGPVEALEVVRRGWIEPSALEAARRSLLDGGGHSGSDLRRVLRLEEWLQSRQRRAPAVIPQRKEVNTDEVLNA